MNSSDIVFPFTAPDWIDEKFANEESLYHNLTYRCVLNIFFNNNRTIYRTIDHQHTEYIERGSIVTLSQTNRTTHLLSLIELIDNEKMKTILMLFLTHAQNINFYHPTKEVNALSMFRQILPNQNYRHSDVLDVLLMRKEIQVPDVVLYMAQCFVNQEHISVILKIFEHETITNNLYMTLLRNYLSKNSILSRKIINSLLDRSELHFAELSRLFLHIFRSDIIVFIPLVDWRNTRGFVERDFCDHIKRIFNEELYYVQNAHGLLQLYNTVVRDFKIKIKVPYIVINDIIVRHRYPEQIILLERMNMLSKYLHLLPYNLPVIQYLRRRFKIRYGKFMQHWKHKTYCPGSKIFKCLSNKYSSIMP